MTKLTNHNALPSVPPRAATFEQLIDIYLQYKLINNHFSTATIPKSYPSILKQAVLHFKKFDVQNVQEIATVHVRDYMLSLDNQGYSNYTVRGYLTVIKGFFSWCHLYDIHKDITRDLRIKRKIGNRFTKSILTQQQIKSCLTHLSKCVSEHSENPYRQKIALRNQAIFYVLLTTGIRGNSLVNLRWKDLDSSGQINYRKKGDVGSARDNWALLSPRCLGFLNQYLATRAGEAQTSETPLFAPHGRNKKYYENQRLEDGKFGLAMTVRNVQHIIRNIFIAADVPTAVARKFTMHSLRHSFAVFHARKHGLEATSDRLDHRDPRSVKPYAAYFEEERRRAQWHHLDFTSEEE